MTAGSGVKLSALLKSQSPLGSCLKILLASSTWGSTESLLIWRGSSTKHNRSLFRLVPSIRHKTGKESGFWATAQARDEKGVTQRFHDGTKRHFQTNSRPHCGRLAVRRTANARGAHRGNPDSVYSALKTSLWPTARNNTGPSTDAKHLSIDGALRTALWPTANASAATGGASKNVNGRNGHAVELQDRLRWALGAITNGSPAPTQSAGPSFAVLQLAFTIWLMGYSWHYLKAFAASYSKHSETPSSRKSPAKSSAQ